MDKREDGQWSPHEVLNLEDIKFGQSWPFHEQLKVSAAGLRGSFRKLLSSPMRISSSG